MNKNRMKVLERELLKIKKIKVDFETNLKRIRDMYDKKGKINKKETPFEDAHNATLKRIRDRFGTKDIVKKLEDALENAHEAKQLLQSFSLTTDSFTDANRLIIDLEITVKSLKGQILGEENNDKNRD